MDNFFPIFFWALFSFVLSFAVNAAGHEDTAKRFCREGNGVFRDGLCYCADAPYLPWTGRVCADDKVSDPDTQPWPAEALAVSFHVGDAQLGPTLFRVRYERTGPAEKTMTLLNTFWLIDAEESRIAADIKQVPTKVVLIIADNKRMYAVTSEKSRSSGGAGFSNMSDEDAFGEALHRTLALEHSGYLGNNEAGLIAAIVAQIKKAPPAILSPIADAAHAPKKKVDLQQIQAKIGSLPQ